MKKYFAPKILVLLVIFPTLVAAKQIETIIGSVNEEEPAVLELINCKAMQRLKGIDQSGPDAYFSKKFPMFTRYDHSLGVYALLKMVGASKNEQIAGLLHDSSHTVFSHVGDIVYQKGSLRKDSYQDSIHENFLNAMGVHKILSKYSLKVSDIHHKREDFKALEQPYPDMNADRIEYNIHTGLVFNDLSEPEAKQILRDLRFENGAWFFTSEQSAVRLASLSSYYTRNFWGSAHNVAIYTASAALFKEAFKKEVISEDDFKYGSDQEILTKVFKSRDPIINKLVEVLYNVDDYYTVSSKDEYDVHQPIKVRAMDPLVGENNLGLRRLSTINPFFANELEQTKEYCRNGVYIKFNEALLHK